jgi:allantoinase
MTDLNIRGGIVVNAASRQEADVAIQNGRIVAVGHDLPRTASEVDARGLFVLPGIVDVHVHFNEPGRTDWEGAATGSRALAAGGGTLFCDMPLNSSPVTVTAADVDRKRGALEAAAVTDFALWGGLVPGHVGDMEAMAERGVIGFKAFMCASGLDEFPPVDDRTLLEGMHEAARLSLPVAVHAENDAIVKRPWGPDVRSFLASRPAIAEVEAIHRATLFAGETGVSLHIVHVSTGRGVAVAAEARARGVDVSIETCPHYLFFSDDDLERLGVIGKCAPPLRPAADREALWTDLASGDVDIVASDHSPAPPALKSGDFVSAWGGIAGVQSTLSVLLERGYHARRLSLERIVDITSRTPARRFRLPGKGSIEVGADADLLLLDAHAAHTLSERDLQQRHKTSPYLGWSFHGRIRRTVIRGTTIYQDGSITAAGGGRFVRPDRENRPFSTAAHQERTHG